MIARLKHGISVKQATEDMHLVANRFRQQFGGAVVMPEGEDVGVQDFHSRVVGTIRPTLLALMGAVGLVLLVVCVNLANLFLARSTVRQREVAVHMALGASNWQLMRLLLTESLLLSSAGGGLGFLLAQFFVPLLTRLGPSDLLQTTAIEVDRTVFAFAALVSLATGLLFGLFPSHAERSTRHRRQPALRQHSCRHTTLARLCNGQWICSTIYVKLREG